MLAILDGVQFKNSIVLTVVVRWEVLQGNRFALVKGMKSSRPSYVEERQAIADELTAMKIDLHVNDVDRASKYVFFSS